MSKSIVKRPEYWFWIKDWVSAIKNRTGWTDEELAKESAQEAGTCSILSADRHQGVFCWCSA